MLKSMTRSSGEVLVLDAIKATWGNFELIQEHFPGFNLAGKVSLWGGDIDSHPIRSTYVRKAKVTRVGY
jgi:hypothetical protein